MKTEPAAKEVRNSIIIARVIRQGGLQSGLQMDYELLGNEKQVLV